MSIAIRAVRAPEETARDFAYRVLAFYLREMLLSPGEKLAESEVAAQLGISRTPVHDTFTQLAREKLLDLRARRAVVPQLNAEQIRQQAWARRTAGEAVLDELYRIRPGKAELEVLEQCVAQEYDELAGGSAVRMARMNHRFYAALYQCAGRMPVHRALRRMGWDLYRMYRLVENPLVWQYIVDHHAAIVQAISTRNHEQAVQALHEQYDLTESILKECYARLPHLFC